MIPFERAIGECCKEMMFVVNAKHMNALFRRSARFVNGTADGMCVCVCVCLDGCTVAALSRG